MDVYPNAKVPFSQSMIKLGKDGKRIISYYVKDNEEKEKIMIKKEEFCYNYCHSKPFIHYNPWKFSNHIINEFNRPLADKIHSFATYRNKQYIAKPFRRPKIYGDYFDKKIYIQ